MADGEADGTHMLSIEELGRRAYRRQPAVLDPERVAVILGVARVRPVTRRTGVGHERMTA